MSHEECGRKSLLLAQFVSNIDSTMHSSLVRILIKAKGRHILVVLFSWLIYYMGGFAKLG